MLIRRNSQVDCSTMAKLRMGRDGKVRRRDWVFPMRRMSVRSAVVNPGWWVWMVLVSSSSPWLVYCGISAAKAVSSLLLGELPIAAFPFPGRVMARD